MYLKLPVNLYFFSKEFLCLIESMVGAFGEEEFFWVCNGSGTRFAISPNRSSVSSMLSQST